MKRFLFLVVLGVALAGCGGSSSTTPSTQPTASSASVSTATTVPTATPIASPTVPRAVMSDTDYLDLLSRYFNLMQQGVGILDTETAAPNINSPEWAGRMEAIVTTFTSADSTFAMLNPTENYQDFQAKWAPFLRTLSIDAQAVQRAVRGRSADSFRTAVVTLKSDWDSGSALTSTAKAAIPTPTRAPSPTPKPSPTPTVVPTPTLTVAQDKAQYRGDVDVRELYKDITKYHGWKLFYTGTVLSISAAGTSTFVQVKVPYGSGVLDTEVIDLSFNASVSTDGIYEGTNVVVWGRPVSMFTITNAYGGKVDQPLLAGDYIEKQ